jgi:hypothetical protein
MKPKNLCNHKDFFWNRVSRRVKGVAHAITYQLIVSARIQRVVPA